MESSKETQKKNKQNNKNRETEKDFEERALGGEEKSRTISLKLKDTVVVYHR